MYILIIEVSLFLCALVTVSSPNDCWLIRCDILVGRVLAINDLPDDDLLAIFDFCVLRDQYLYFLQLNQSDVKGKIESWQSLVHVCRR